MPETGTSGSMSGMWKRSMVRIVRHRQTKGPATDRPNLTHRATSRLHHLDSTNQAISVIQVAPFDFHRSFSLPKPRRACDIRGTVVRVMNDAKLIYEETPPLSVFRIRS